MQNAVTAEVVEPYAEALISLAQEKNLTDEIGNNIRSLKDLFNQSAELKTFLSSPLVKAEDKKEVIKKIADGQINSFFAQFFITIS